MFLISEPRTVLFGKTPHFCFKSHFGCGAAQEHTIVTIIIAININDSTQRSNVVHERVFYGTRRGPINFSFNQVTKIIHFTVTYHIETSH